jgi:SAM-dependent methyltransferase
MEDLHCIICGHNRSVHEKYSQTFSDELLTPAIFSARRITEHWHYRILRCATCSLVFSSPVLSQKRLQELYGESTITYTKEIANITRSYARHLQPYINSIPNRATALEIGCGSGFFLEWLKTIGFCNLIGFEPSAAAVSDAPGWLRPNIRQIFFEQDESFKPGSVDLICSFQTLDHLKTPLQTLEKCRRLLCKGGLAYFITHNERALQARLLGEKSPIFDIEHIYLFNKKTLRAIFEKAGFEVIDIVSVRNTYSLIYWMTMTPMPMKRFLLLAFRFFGILNMPLSLHAGNIGVIARRM